MKVIVNTAEVLLGIRSRSHGEVASVEDPEKRYLIEAGSEKELELTRVVYEADAALTALCGRMLRRSYSSSATPQQELPQNLEYDFDVSERRWMMQSDGFARALQSYLIDYALYRFYVSVSAGDLAKIHDVLATADAAVIERYLYEKLPPRL